MRLTLTSMTLALVQSPAQGTAADPALVLCEAERASLPRHARAQAQR